MTTRTPLPIALALLAALAAVPAATAQDGIGVRVALEGQDASVDTPDASPAQQAADAAGVDAPPVPDEVQDVIELTSANAQTRGDAAGFDFSASAAADLARRGAEAAKDALPAVKEHAPEVVATAGFLALLQALGVWRVLGVGAFALYSRLTKSDLLDNGHRDRVYKLIQENPGLGLSQISQITGLGWGTTVYHLDRLERVGFVASERGGLHKCYFPVGTVAKETRKGIGALKADTTRSIAAFLVSKPGATQTELCEALGLSASAASKQVSKLEEAGLVRREREWKTVRLIPNETLPALLMGDASPAGGASTIAPAPALVTPLPA